MKYRTNIFSICFYLFILFFFLFFATSSYSETNPYIINISDTQLRRTMVISGGDYSPESVKVVVHFPGTNLKDRKELPAIIKNLSENYKKFSGQLPSVPPKNNTVTVEPIHATKHSVFAELRSPVNTVPPGNQTAIVWLKDGEQLSEPLVVNKPEAWFLLKKKSRPGELNRIYGLNIKSDPYVENYVYITPENGTKPIELSKEPIHKEDGWIGKFSIQFRIPDDIKPGNYKVFAHNNSGNEYGFTNALSLEILPEMNESKNLYIATEYGVKGDSVTDNQQSLQKVVDTAEEHGGGIVFLPPGSYRVDGTIQLHENITLRGAGRDATTLFYGGDASDKESYPWLISARGVDKTGLEDITIRISYPKGIPISYYNAGEPTFDTHILRTKFVGGKVSIHYNINMEIGNTIFDGARLHIHNLKYGWIHNNKFSKGRLRGSPIHFWAMENSTIEYNSVSDSNRGFVWQIFGDFGHYHNFINANTVEDIRMGGNAGETFLFEGAGHKWSGKPDSIQRSGFTVEEAGWEPDSLKNAFAIVTSGRGKGQYVRIKDNTDRRVELEKPWRIPPSGDIRISVMHGVVENVFVNNLDRDSDNSMMFFSAGAINNRIYRNRSENSLGITVWSKADNTKDILVPDYYNIFDGNVLEDQGSFWITRLGNTMQVNGTRNLNNIFRNNFIADARRKRENQYWNIWESKSPGWFNPVQPALDMKYGRLPSKSELGPIWTDTLIERNYITRCHSGINIEKIGEGTVVYRNTFFDVEMPITDNGVNSKILNNTIKELRTPSHDGTGLVQ